MDRDRDAEVAKLKVSLALPIVSNSKLSVTESLGLNGINSCPKS